MKKESLILTGFMGAGKSTIGNLLAADLKVPYSDTDRQLEQDGVDVPRLMKQDLEKFRNLEAQALYYLLSREPGVIATGGGIVSKQIGRDALRAAGERMPVVWIDVPFELLAERVARDLGRERPLFADTNAARKLYDERHAWYMESSTDKVDGSQSREKVVDAIRKIALSHEAFSKSWLKK